MAQITPTKKPRVILGLMTFGPDETTGARITSLDTFKSSLDYFQTQGYTEIDTARVYVGGKQEAWTKEAGWQERGLRIATKWYPHEHGAHKGEKVREKLEESLRELGLEGSGRGVDIFYLHAADRGTPFPETLKTINDLYKEGKFVQFGLSNFTAFEVAEIVTTCKLNSWIRPTIYQGMYNAITRSIESELIPALRRYGLSLVVYNPLAGGLFSGKIKAPEDAVEGRFGGKSEAITKNYRARYFRDATWDALRHVQPVVERHGLTLLETALRWTRWHSKLNIDEDQDGRERDGVIIGVSSQAQLESNLADLEKGPLPEEVVTALDEAWAITKGTTPNYWHLDLKYSYGFDD